jgi:predicted restriction endonuclease
MPKNNGIGEPSSKYGYDKTGEQFNRDMQEHKERSDALWSAFVQFMKEHCEDPRDVRAMFTRYYEEFCQ